MIEVFNTNGHLGLDFETPKLAQVNLIVGPNGVGKSKLLNSIWNTDPNMVVPVPRDRVVTENDLQDLTDLDILFAPYFGLRQLVKEYQYNGNDFTCSSGHSSILSLLVAMNHAKDKTLLVDEIENGIYYEEFSKLWKHLFYLAKLWNVQIIATTHSRDCIHGFAEQALEDADMALLFRMGHSVRTSDKGNVIATTYRGEEFRYLSYHAGYIECR